MKYKHFNTDGDRLLICLFIVAVSMLAFQSFPSFWSSTIWALDVRNWPRNVWFAVNWVVLSLLVAIRFGPNLFSEWRERKKNREADQARLHRQIERKQQREAMDQRMEARKRRLY